MSMHITTCTTLQHPKDKKSTKACMGSCKLGSLRRNYWQMAEGTRLNPEQNNAWAVDTWVVSNHLFSCRWQLWGKRHWRRTCPAPPINGAKISYVLIQKGRGKILQTHHQVGLCWQEGAPFDAIICWESIKALSASSTYCTAGSAASSRQKSWMVQSKKLDGAKV